MTMGLIGMELIPSERHSSLFPGFLLCFLHHLFHLKSKRPNWALAMGLTLLRSSRSSHNILFLQYERLQPFSSR